MQELFQELLKDPEIFTIDGSVNLFLLPEKEGYSCELSIGPDALEWYTTIKNKHSGQVVYSNWVDYLGYDDTPENQLIEQKVSDIKTFVSDWKAVTQVRLITKSVFFGVIKTKYFELNLNGHWTRF